MTAQRGIHDEHHRACHTTTDTYRCPTSLFRRRELEIEIRGRAGGDRRERKSQSGGWIVPLDLGSGKPKAELTCIGRMSGT